MTPDLKKKILERTQSSQIKWIENIQELWSGYGIIQRIHLQSNDFPSVILKHIKLPSAKKQSTSFSHQRKLRSYQIEMEWYQSWNPINLKDQCSPSPNSLLVEKEKGEYYLLLEDLNTLGFPLQLRQVNWQQMKVCLCWLANFHAKFLHVKPDQLWKTGTYWHLKTRPDEFKKIAGTPLSQIASRLDQELNASPFLTFVHGDAKLANFCFSSDRQRVAAVDFQYVGGGCGMKDLAYFVGSCFSEKECEKNEMQILNTYFKELQSAVERYQKKIDFPQLEANWRKLYYYAWCDFYRFLQGWSPEHWSLNTYSRKVEAQIMKELLERN